MTLSIRWDSSDTTYISGPPSERYVHFPLEIASSTQTAVNVAVYLNDASGAEIVSQNFEDVPVSADYAKFSPAVLVPDSYFNTPQTWTIKGLIYTNTVPIEIPRSVTKTIPNTPATQPGSKNMLLGVLGLGLVFLAFGGKRLLK